MPFAITKGPSRRRTPAKYCSTSGKPVPAVPVLCGATCAPAKRANTLCLSLALIGYRDHARASHAGREWDSTVGSSPYAGVLVPGGDGRADVSRGDC